MSSYIKGEKSLFTLRHFLALAIIAISVPIAVISCTGREQVMADMAKQGEQLFYSAGCDKCHSLKGDDSLYGPPLDSFLNKEVAVIRKGGRKLIRADRKYITRSITHPDADKLEGYSGKTMPPASLSNEDIKKIVDFIVYLNSDTE